MAEELTPQATPTPSATPAESAQSQTPSPQTGAPSDTGAVEVGEPEPGIEYIPKSEYDRLQDQLQMERDRRTQAEKYLFSEDGGYESPAPQQPTSPDGATPPMDGMPDFNKIAQQSGGDLNAVVSAIADFVGKQAEGKVVKHLGTYSQAQQVQAQRQRDAMEMQQRRQIEARDGEDRFKAALPTMRGLRNAHPTLSIPELYALAHVYEPKLANFQPSRAPQAAPSRVVKLPTGGRPPSGPATAAMPIRQDGGFESALAEQVDENKDKLNWER